MTVTVLLLFLAVIILLLRFSLWLAIFQQKEYRLDRILTYLKSQQGLIDLFFISDFKTLFKTGPKRPVKTLRIHLLSLVTLVLMFAPLVLIFDFWQSNQVNLLYLMVLLAMTLPIFMFMANLFVEILVRYQQKKIILQAQNKILQNQPLVIGITGSYGKTSTKLVLAAILESKFDTFFTEKSYNKLYSISLNIAQNYQKEKFAIIEYGAYTRNEIEKVAKFFQPNIAIITGLAPQHLALFGSIRNIIKAKSELIQALPDQGQVYYNQNDAGCKQIVDFGLKHNPNKITTQSYSPQELIQKSSLNYQGKLKFQLFRQDIQTQLVGHQYLENIAAAIKVSLHLGVDQEKIIQSLVAFSPKSNFISSLQHQSGAVIIDDGHTCNSQAFKAGVRIIETISEKKENQGKKKTLIFPGIIDLGPKKSTVHNQLAQIASQVFDQILYTSKVGFNEFREICPHLIIDKKDEIAYKIDNLSQNDLLLIEGLLPKNIRKKIDDNTNI